MKSVCGNEKRLQLGEEIAESAVQWHLNAVVGESQPCQRGRCSCTSFLDDLDANLNKLQIGLLKVHGSFPLA